VQQAADPVPRFGHRHRLRVGLLGGSFNPAHAGHRHVAEIARRRLRLDQVWLMVSPGNPLKRQAGMAPMAERLAGARALSDGRRILTTAIERRLGTRYTADTLRALRRLFPLVQFVWLMGSDILAELPAWRHWLDVVRAVPFAVLPRPNYNRRALAGLVAKRFHRALQPARAAVLLANAAAPAWTFLPASQKAISATALRAAYSLPIKEVPASGGPESRAKRLARQASRLRPERPRLTQGAGR
jgi:nicotinate-nucleotide adenylyltransferase